ncbi:MAG: flagellar biosynthesis anti-sigma factor FlgM [Acidobacteriota bacterium]|nr:MAG: flagellar biosynthesis anti-sigma factor FlgM [Acidobacteriota bacterium]
MGKMKVHGTDPLGRLQNLLDRLEGADKLEPSDARWAHGQAPPPAARDAIQLSEQAQELGRLREALASSPEIRQELVERLREQIGSGLYRVDGTRVADAMLREELVHAPAGDGEGADA